MEILENSWVGRAVGLQILQTVENNECIFVLFVSSLQEAKQHHTHSPNYKSSLRSSWSGTQLQKLKLKILGSHHDLEGSDQDLECKDQGFRNKASENT